jgi:hypothetical protein
MSWPLFWILPLQQRPVKICNLVGMGISIVERVLDGVDMCIVVELGTKLSIRVR